MSVMEQSNTESQYALQVAFKTMKERCQQLQTRLAAVEEENACLRQQSAKNLSIVESKTNEKDECKRIQSQQEQIKELQKQKSQLANHIYMVSFENRQLWKRLSKLSHTNKSLGNQLSKISEFPTLTYSYKEIPGFIRDKNFISDNEEKEQSLEEISLQLIKDNLTEKTELKQQYNELMELQSNVDINFKNIGFTYPEDIEDDSLEHLKYHDMKLTKIKDILIVQQKKLNDALQNLKNIKKSKICINCKNTAEKLLRQIGTQADSSSNVKDNKSTQTNSLAIDLVPDTKTLVSDDENICPLCGDVYEKSVSFELFHEHVISHFTQDISTDFELIT